MNGDQFPQEADQNPQKDPQLASVPPLESPEVSNVSAAVPVRKKKRLGAVLIAAAAVFVIAAGSAAGYFGYVVPNKPENILKAALGNALTNQAGQSKGELEISGQGASATVSFDSKMDAKQKLAQLAFELTVSGLSLPAEVRYADESAFVKIGDVSALKTLAQLTGLDGALLDELFATAEQTVVGKWIEIDKTVIGQSDEAKCTLEADWTLSEGDAALLQEAYAQNEFVTIKSHSDDTVGGRAAVKYELDFDATKAQQFSEDKKLEELSVLARLSDCAEATTEEGVEDQVTDGLEATTMTVWVDKDTKHFSRYAMAAASEGTKIAVNATLGYEPVSVDRPENTTPIMDVIAEFQRVLGQGGAPTADVLGVFDGAGLN